MSIVKRTENGKIKFDWGVIATMVACSLLGGLTAAPGVYYGIKYDQQQDRYRIEQTEKKVSLLEIAVKTIELKDAADSRDFSHACETLNEIKRAVDDIRKDQQRLQKKER